MLRRVNLCDLDLDRAYFHFTKTIDLARIEKNNLTPEISASLAMVDSSRRLYFSTGVNGMLKYHDVYLKWMMNNTYGEKNLRKKYDDDVFKTKMYEWTKEFLSNEYKNDEYKKNTVFTKYYHDMLECTYLVINVSNACDYNKDEYDEDVGDTNIDFRRVRNIKVYLDRNALKLANDSDFNPGDIVVYKKHIAIVSDRVNSKNENYILHQHMYQAYEYDGLFKNEILGHYRWRLNDGKK